MRICFYGDIMIEGISNMNIRKAKLIKRRTDDGMFEVKDHLKIGLKYYIYINSIILSDGFHTPTKTPWHREIVFCTDGQWLPTELLKIDGLT